jgi:hypothetical protein
VLRLSKLNLGLSASGSGQAYYPPIGTPSLIVDFVPSPDDADWLGLGVDFVSGAYLVNDRDPRFPDDLVNIQIWS